MQSCLSDTAGKLLELNLKRNSGGLYLYVRPLATGAMRPRHNCVYALRLRTKRRIDLIGAGTPPRSRSARGLVLPRWVRVLWRLRSNTAICSLRPRLIRGLRSNTAIRSLRPRLIRRLRSNTPICSLRPRLIRRLGSNTAICSLRPQLIRRRASSAGRLASVGRGWHVASLITARPIRRRGCRAVLGPRRMVRGRWRGARARIGAWRQGPLRSGWATTGLSHGRRRGTPKPAVLGFARAVTIIPIT